MAVVNLGISSQKYASILLLLVIIFISLAMGNMSMFSGSGRGGLSIDERAHLGINSHGINAGFSIGAEGMAQKGMVQKK
jgi:hypothetical protein